LTAARIADPDEVRQEYARGCAFDFATMDRHLPERVDHIVEVGCGMGGVQVLMQRRYPQARVTLVDGTGSNIEHAGTPREVGKGGYNKTLTPYSSREHTELLLRANGARVDRWVDVNSGALLDADLIFSISSWGYHYPFATYKARGTVICDLRRGIPANEPIIAACRASKNGSKVIFTGPKFERCMWRENV
jgi:hypothetical protein